jgi:uncharacterized iron-regulated membrane protein
VHYWLSIVVAAPVLLIIVSGLLLHVKKDFHWIQPTERRGTGGTPRLSLEEILSTCLAVTEVNVHGWEDIDRVDVRPGKSLIKVTTKDNWEIQLDPADGRVLQVATRRSDMLEALHDGSWFGGIVNRWVFLPSGVMLLTLWATGLYLFVLPLWRKRKR